MKEKKGIFVSKEVIKMIKKDCKPYSFFMMCL